MTDRSARLLRRRTTDRVIFGVAGGLADYFNVDPLLIRIAFVGLIIFGGAGLVLYFLAWLLLPAEGQDASMVESFFRRLGLTPRSLAWAALAILMFIVIQAAINPGGYVSLGEGPTWVALAAVAGGIWLLRRREAVPAAATVPTVVAPRRAPAVPRPRSPLGWYIVAATLIAVGLLAIVSQVAEIEVEPGQFFGAALAVMGIGLVIGAWWGRARILILLALLLMPVALAASFVTAPLEGGVGAPRFIPANAAELRDEYRLLGGQLTLDLTELSVGRRDVQIGASVAVGQVTVILPRDASVELRMRAGAGQVTLFNEYNVGTQLDDVYVRHHRFGTTYILDLEVGIGEVLVINDIGPDF